MPPPNSGIAPGQQLYDPNHGNGAHMPPPLNIPQNNGQHPNAMSAAGNGMMSPNSAGMVRRAAPEPNKRALYVGGLDQRVTEEVLKQIFETTGHVQSVKVIPDKNVSGHGLPSFGLSRLRLLAQSATACRMRGGGIAILLSLSHDQLASGVALSLFYRAVADHYIPSSSPRG